MKYLFLKFIKLLRDFFTPSHNEMSIFLASFTFIILFLFDAVFRSLILNFVSSAIGLSGISSREFLFFFSFIGTFIFGLVLSIYHAFSKSPKSQEEKECMLFFAMAINGIAGMSAGLYMLKSSSNYLIVFPLWNITNGVILLYQIGLIDENWEDNAEATFPQIIIGTIFIVILFIICHFFCNLYWAITFSVCITYATSINNTIQKIFNFVLKK